jgi:hypothetical protein
VEDAAYNMARQANHLEVGPSWDLASGKGLEPKSLTHWERLRACGELADALVDSEAWWDHVDAIRRGGNVVLHARAYVRRADAEQPRRVIEEELRISAAAKSLEHARYRMTNGDPLVARIENDEPYPEEPSPDGRRRAIRADRQRTIALGARLIAVRGAHRCLRRECGHALLSGTGQRDYCSACETSERLDTPSPADLVRVQHREAIRVVFELVTPVILGPA